MASDLVALCVDANAPHRLARFWASVLGWATAEDNLSLAPTDDSGFGIRFLESRHQKSRQNLIHFHLTSSSLHDQGQTVARSLGFGARHIDVGQRPEEGHVVLGDPEGNEFCVIEPGNAFLADCGFLGELACDGSQDVGHFWSHALGWPLVWDQDQETSIRSPLGGPKISWGGPPLMPRAGTTRFHFDLAPAGDGDQLEEVERLVALGARVLHTGLAAGRTVMADPDGNEFCLLGAGRRDPAPH